ncbi:toxic protein SymE [Flavobacterium sp. 28YEA47A]|uniref:SymE family type I addiction module toxin n=1 Tax=Flavobacterium sp. 28YEA47A TaxID=3156276 RepID=UPI0035144B2B
MCNVKLSDQDDETKLIDTRRIKVYKEILVGPNTYPHDYSSKILLMGKWVRNCGFEPDDRLTISVYKCRIVVEKEKPGTIDTKLLARVQKQSDESLKQKIKSLVSPEVFARLSFENGDIKWDR